MKLIVIGGFLLFFASATCQAAPEFHETEEEFEEEFGIKVSDDKMREHLAENLKAVEEQINKNNKAYDEGKSTFTEKLYEFSNLDMEDLQKMKEGLLPTPENVSARRVFARGLIPTPESLKHSAESEAYLRRFYNRRQTTPESYNAVEEGIVTTPKNQQSCGSCAAFSASALHETCMMKAGASMNNMDLSEQHLIDCAYDEENNDGCKGALIHTYQDWFQKNGGVGVHEADQPYLNTNPILSCPNKPTWNSGAKVNSVSWDYSCNEEKMKTLVSTHGAVSVALYSSTTAFMNYAGGVIQGTCSNIGDANPDHAVLVVGYGEENGVPYWLIKNSWGTSWGEGGYVKVKRGTNECKVEGICVVSECVATGGSPSPTPPAPTPPAPAPTPNNLKCDISGLFGPDITGSYKLEYFSYISDVECTNSICTPKNPTGIDNACMYICGSTTCDGSPSPSPSPPAPTPPAPAPPAPTPTPNNLTCDMSGLFGSSDISGSYELELFGISSKVKCTNSVCTPQDPTGIDNACMYMCGSTTC